MQPSSVTLAEMLDARERRAAAQSAMLASADERCCLVSFSLNIAGDVKRTAKTRLLFDRGLALFDALGFAALDRRITETEYRRVRDHMIALGLPGFLQEPDSADRDFIPVFNELESFV